MARASRFITDKLLELKPHRIYEVLIKKDVTPCVAMEWSKEPERRAAMLTRNQRRSTRKLMSSSGRRYTRRPYRRILKTIVGKGRDHLGHLHERQFHATKGWRSYRVVE